MPRVLRGSSFLLPVLFLLGLCNAADKPVPGQNINMVSGTTFPGGDPFLQRQNEPSIAVSTRNPQHLLAGANDYRTVDLNPVDNLPNFDQPVTGDAWLGIFKSLDGGQTWRSTLHPGFLQDISAIGSASPLKGLKAASDPVVRAAKGGLFAYAGIAFNRDQNKGVTFISRFLDMNNKENGDPTQNTPTSFGTDPIRFVDTKVLATGTAGQFLDKEWVATYSPGSGTCTINVPGFGAQTIPLSYLYFVYTVFTGNTDQVIRTKIYFTRSTDCGNTWSNAIKLSEGVPVNQGAQVGVDPRNGTVYVVWRQFASNNQPDAINIVKSTDFGQTFTKAQAIWTLPKYALAATPSTDPSFFDEGSTVGSIRTNAFPSIAVSDNGVVYLAWTQRGAPGSNHKDSARIVLTSSADGITWTPPSVIDDGPMADSANPDSLYANFNADPSLSYDRGHQFMPALIFGQGKLMLLYYDQRFDHTLAEYTQLSSSFEPGTSGKFYNQTRPPKGGHLGLDTNPVDIFNGFLSDFRWGSICCGQPLQFLNRRHTIEVRMAQIDLTTGEKSFATVSQYKFGLRNDGTDVSGELQQLQVNPANLPIYARGTIPFLGDYVDLVIAPTQPGSAPVAYATWTTNQNVLPGVNPQTGNVDWTLYTPPGAGAAQSTFDPTQPRAACNPSTHAERSRNQDIYSSRITQGLAVSSPQNVKPFTKDAANLPLQRAFVLFLQNLTGVNRSFRATIANQPVSGFASFVQRANPLPASLTPESSAANLNVEVTVPAGSGVARTVFAASTSASVGNPIIVNVVETTTSGSLGLNNFVVLNGDPTSPQLINPDGATDNISNTETYNSVIIQNPNPLNPNPLNPNPLNKVVSNPNPLNPNPLNPNPLNPNPLNPNPLNPNPLNPDIADPNPLNPNPLNTDPTNTALLNPNPLNPNPLNSNVNDEPNSDATYAVSNNGNTNAGYKVTLAGTPTNTPLQVIVSKTYLTAQSQNCTLYGQQEPVVLSNIPNAAITSVDFSTPNPLNSAPDDGTFSLGPGESALITIRGQNVYCKRQNAGTIRDTGCREAPPGAIFMEDIINNITPVVISQAANTNIDTDGAPPTPSFSTPLFITTTSTLPETEARSGTFDGATYSVTLSAVGGKAPYTFSLFSGSLPPGLGLNTPGCGAGVICGVPTAAGDFAFTIQATDSSNPPLSSRKNFTIHIFPVLAITTTALPDVLSGFPYSATVEAAGGKPPYTWSIASGSALPKGLNINAATGVISGTESGVGGGTFVVAVTDALGVSRTAQFVMNEAQITFTGTAVDGQPGDSGAGSDLTSLTVSYWSADVVEITLQYAVENFNPQTSAAVVFLDTDQNPATGNQGINEACTIDDGVIGVENLVFLNSGFGGNQAQLFRWTGGCNNFAGLGTVPVQILPAGTPNGMRVRFNRSQIDPGDGLKNRFLVNFKATSILFLNPGFTGILDIITDEGLPPGQTTQVPIIQ
jgi:Putative Ig domain